MVKKVVCQKLAWEQPHPAKNQTGRYMVKNVANLPNSLTEDIRGFSIAPLYSFKELREIKRRKTKKTKLRNAFERMQQEE